MTSVFQYLLSATVPVSYHSTISVETTVLYLLFSASTIICSLSLVKFLIFPLFQLGLPSSSICSVPLYKNTHKMDMKALVQMVEGDTEAGKTPVMVVAYAGTPVVGHVDELGMLRDLCKKQDLWLHIEG